MQQSTKLDPDVVKVHTVWNIGSWNVLELSQHKETFYSDLQVTGTRRWRF